MKRKVPKPPKYLDLSYRKLWKTICQKWDFNDAELQVLASGLASLQRRDQARMLIDSEGLIVKSGNGTVHAHPAAAIEKSAHQGWLAAFGALHLREDEVEMRPGRPGGRKHVEYA